MFRSKTAIIKCLNSGFYKETAVFAIIDDIIGLVAVDSAHK
jgi:hypothetical protein